jgi:hypothetical protein
MKHTTGLINPLLLKSDLLKDTINYKPPDTSFNINIKYVMFNIIFPVLLILILCIILKQRYKAKLEKTGGKIKNKFKNKNLKDKIREFIK